MCVWLCQCLGVRLFLCVVFYQGDVEDQESAPADQSDHEPDSVAHLRETMQVVEEAHKFIVQRIGDKTCSAYHGLVQVPSAALRLTGVL